MSKYLANRAENSYFCNIVGLFEGNVVYEVFDDAALIDFGEFYFKNGITRIILTLEDLENFELKENDVILFNGFFNNNNENIKEYKKAKYKNQCIFIENIMKNINVVERVDEIAFDVIKKTSISTMFMGLSFSEKAMHSVVDDDVLVTALSSQDIRNDVNLARFLYSNAGMTKGLKDVFINLSYFSFDYDLRYTFENVREYRYLNLISEKSIEKSFGMHLRNFVYHTMAEFNSYRMMFDDLITGEMSEAIYGEIRNTSNHHGGFNNAKVREENIQILNNWIVELNGSGIRPNIVVLPTSSIYNEHYNVEQKERFHNIIGQLQGKVDFDFADLTNNNIFKDSHFF